MKLGELSCKFRSIGRCIKNWIFFRWVIDKPNADPLVTACVCIIILRQGAPFSGLCIRLVFILPQPVTRTIKNFRCIYIFIDIQFGPSQGYWCVVRIYPMIIVTGSIPIDSVSVLQNVIFIITQGIREIFIGLRIGSHGSADLPESGRTKCSFGNTFSEFQSREQNRKEQCDHSDNHQQFDECKSSLFHISLSIQTCYFYFTRRSNPRAEHCYRLPHNPYIFEILRILYKAILRLKKNDFAQRVI